MYSYILYSTILDCPVLYSSVLYCAIGYCSSILAFHAIRCYALLNDIIWHLRYDTILYANTLYDTLL